MRVSCIEDYIVPCLDQAAHGQQWLVDLHNLKAHQQWHRAITRGKNLGMTLSKIHNDATIRDFIFDPSLDGSRERNVARNRKRNDSVRRAGVDSQHNSLPMRLIAGGA